MNNDAAANEVLDGLGSQTDPSIFKAANGLELKMKRVSAMILAEANRKLVPPRPPKVFIDEKGREEENPNDPNYVLELQHFDYDRGMLAAKVYYGLGTAVHKLPRDLEPPESQVWSDNIEAVYDGIDIPATGVRRYVEWLKLYALPEEDQGRLLSEILRFTGSVLEVDVIEAQASFRGNQERDTAPRVPSPIQAQRGLGDGTHSGYDSGVRSQGGSPVRALPVDELDGESDLV
jgi:hypothetical protein